MKIALVEFLNAYPLYYALKKRIVKNNFEFLSYPPSICASLLRSGRVDVGNVPIVEYVHSDEYKILNSCCISSNKEVKSVVLFLDKPINKIKTVRLDRNSNTSNILTKVLFAFKYNLRVDFTFDGDADCEVVIGDRALKKIQTSNGVKLDLAVEWHEMTGLPFVFAAWITNKNIETATKHLFIESKEWGKKNIDMICEDFSKNRDLINRADCKSYLTDNISYDLTQEKIESIKKFFSYAKQCGALKSVRDKIEII